MLWEKRVRHNFNNKVILTFVFPIPQMNYKINLDTANPKVASLKVNKENYGDKFALLWGEAQLCLPYVCLEQKIAYSYPKVT